MYRKVFTPTESDHIIPLTIPREWYGLNVEILAFPVIEHPSDEKTHDNDFMQLCGAWESEQPAEEMAADIRNASCFTEKDLTL